MSICGCCCGDKKHSTRKLKTPEMMKLKIGVGPGLVFEAKHDLGFERIDNLQQA
jgi:hypothetical protein